MRAWTVAPVALVASLAFAPQATADPIDPETVVVERVKPEKTKLSTLRFLTENKDFLRSQLDRLRQAARERDGDADPIDPRYLTYRQMLRDQDAARDAIASWEADEERELLTRISELASLESELDAMEQMLDEQSGRLDDLEADFVGRQHTQLVVLVRGYPAAADVDAIEIVEDGGGRVTVLLDDVERHSLREGGIAQIYHEFVEPREQTFEVVLQGAAWPETSSGYLTFTPERGRLGFLELDLSSLEATSGAIGIHATRWTDDVVAEVAEADTGGSRSSVSTPATESRP